MYSSDLAELADFLSQTQRTLWFTMCYYLFLYLETLTMGFVIVDGIPHLFGLIDLKDIIIHINV